MIIKISLEKRIVNISNRLNKFCPPLFSLFKHICGHLFHFVLGEPFLVDMPDNSFHFNKVDYPGKLLFRTDWYLNWYRVGIQSILNLLNYSYKIGSGPVHLIDESNSRNVVLGCLSPNSLRLRLNTSNCTEYCHGTIKNP